MIFLCKAVINQFSTMGYTRSSMNEISMTIKEYPKTGERLQSEFIHNSDIANSIHWIQYYKKLQNTN